MRRRWATSRIFFDMDMAFSRLYRITTFRRSVTELMRLRFGNKPR